jgi:hypothetical protein
VNAVHNARVQLLANLLNTMAGSSFTVGVAAPIAAFYFYGTATLTLLRIALGACAWLTIAAVLHPLAQTVWRG